MIVDSGGGYQGFFLLDAPVVMEGERGERSAAPAPFEDRNRRIEVALGGDDCPQHRPDYEVAGHGEPTGREEAQEGADSARWRTRDLRGWSLRYRLADFAPLAKAATATAKTGPIRAVTAVADVDVSALPLSDRVKALIVTGDDPDDPGPLGRPIPPRALRAVRDDPRRGV